MTEFAINAIKGTGMVEALPLLTGAYPHADSAAFRDRGARSWDSDPEPPVLRLASDDPCDPMRDLRVEHGAGLVLGAEEEGRTRD